MLGEEGDWRSVEHRPSEMEGGQSSLMANLETTDLRPWGPPLSLVWHLLFGLRARSFRGKDRLDDYGVWLDWPMDRNGSLCTKAGTRQVPLLEQ